MYTRPNGKGRARDLESLEPVENNDLLIGMSGKVRERLVLDTETGE